ncbi:MAG: hypothetical protein QN141_02545 [Armatimonadota bacterium]|nr:hypothetical protein [Armatimonadota bacterium]MDR7450779.1 hypothetical protein [Armatimonadota bacterium]MDR7466135.1 hypothetical protein [Armatimonadota bacterium]MDR7493828.1 hypothetical protein [Armatimonadota bacterium]MDR7499011.1 hypothetical protein [Armatimonadota bacterium]
MPSLLLQQPPPPPPGSVPGIGDAAAVAVGTLLSLLVLYAIVAARFRRAR